MPRDWDAATYDRLASPMARWGQAVVGWLELAGTEPVLDAGCGSGRVTEHLLERLPEGHVIALDGSPAMIGSARERLSRFGDRVRFLVADLTQPLPIDEPVDAILSTATFHWIADHDSLFHGLAQVLRRGGQLAAQCGGAGNITSIEAALRDLGQDARGRKHYATVEATRNRLLAAGFDDIETWLHDEPKRFVHEVAVRLPGPHIDYVRLNIRARRT